MVSVSNQTFYLQRKKWLINIKFKYGYHIFTATLKFIHLANVVIECVLCAGRLEKITSQRSIPFPPKGSNIVWITDVKNKHKTNTWLKIVISAKKKKCLVSGERVIRHPGLYEEIRETEQESARHTSSVVVTWFWFFIIKHHRARALKGMCGLCSPWRVKCFNSIYKVSFF